MKISFSNKKDLSRLLCFAIFLCFFDAVLRVQEKNGLTFDRFFLVIPVVALMIHETRAYFRMVLFFLFFAFYNALLSLKFGSFKHYFEMTFHYFVISHIFLFVNYLIGFDKGRRRLLSTITLGCYLFIFVTLLEIIFNFHLPNVDIYGNGEHSSFFRIANDMSLALAAFIPILYLMDYEGRIPRVITIITICVVFFLCDHNHTKTALGAIILYCLLFFMRTYRIKISIALLIIAIFLLMAKNVTLHISYQKYSIDELIIEPIKNLLTFQTYQELGSIETRVNASIIGIKELTHTYATGIGYGNSVTLLARPENHLDFAKSLHNDTLAFLLEEGLLAVVIYFYGVSRAFSMSKNTKDYFLRIKLCCFYTFPIAILSSSGATANYFFLTCLFTLILIEKKSRGKEKEKIPKKSILEKPKVELYSVITT